MPAGPGVAAAVEQQPAPSASARPIAAATFSRAAAETIGQTSVEGSRPSPTTSSAAAPASASRSSPWRASSPTETQTEPARQRCPAAPKAEPMIAGSARSRSASGITTSEFLAPPSACTRLPVATAPLGDDPRRLGPADEGDRVDPRVVEQRVDRVAGAVDEVDDAGRDLLDRVDQLDDQRRRPRVVLGGLEDEGVAAGDRVGQEPERDHRREVERRDRGDDADRLADHLDVDAGGDAFERLALEQVRDRRRRLDRLDPAADLAVGVGERLAHVGADQRDQFVAAPQQRLAQGEHRARPRCGGSVAPAGLRRARRLDRRVDVGGAESGTRGDDLAGGRVDVVERLDSVGRRPLAADVVPQQRRRGSTRSSALRRSAVGGPARPPGRAGPGPSVRPGAAASHQAHRHHGHPEQHRRDHIDWTGMPRSPTPKM